MKARALRTLPNLISSSRLVLAAAFSVTNQPDTRVALVGLAAATDFLDGWVARRGNYATRLGALIDPFADRVFALVAVSTFLFEGAISTIGFFILISRDLMTAIGFLVARSVSWLRPVEFRARSSGKVVTVLQMLAFIVILKAPQAVHSMLLAVGLASAYSIVDYTYALWRARAR
jgi:CDP-diacylglycerol---glycerol-3-phosphate 3-phosphatidyltransferase